jgi:hypothetical protein
MEVEVGNDFHGLAPYHKSPGTANPGRGFPEPAGSRPRPPGGGFHPLEQAEKPFSNPPGLRENDAYLLSNARSFTCIVLFHTREAGKGLPAPGGLAALYTSRSRLDKDDGMEKIDKETLRGWLGDPGVFIIDVRTQADWEGSPVKVEHAHRFDPQKVTEWAQDLPRDKKLVLY